MSDIELLRKRVMEVFESSNLNKRIRLTFTDVGISWLVTVAESVVSLEETKEGEAITEFKATLAHALAIFNRKLSPTKALVVMKLRVSGELNVALTVTELLKKPIPADSV